MHSVRGEYKFPCCSTSAAGVANTALATWLGYRELPDHSNVCGRLENVGRDLLKDFG